MINKHIKPVEKNEQERTFKRKRKYHLKLKERENTASKETKIPLVLTYNRSLSNISKVVRKYWNILSINKSFKEFFRMNQNSFQTQQTFEGTNW